MNGTKDSLYDKTLEVTMFTGLLQFFWGAPQNANISVESPICNSEKHTTHFWAICHGYQNSSDRFSAIMRSELKKLGKTLQNAKEICFHGTLPTKEQLVPFSGDRHVVLLVSDDPMSISVFQGIEKCFYIFACCSPSDINPGNLCSYDSRDMKKQIIDLSSHTGYLRTKEGSRFAHRYFGVLLPAVAGCGDLFELFHRINSNPAYKDDDDEVYHFQDIELCLDGISQMPQATFLDRYNVTIWMRDQNLSELMISLFSKLYFQGPSLELFYAYDCFRERIANQNKIASDAIERFMVKFEGLIEPNLNEYKTSEANNKNAVWQTYLSRRNSDFIFSLGLLDENSALSMLSKDVMVKILESKASLHRNARSAIE
jgi:hypothetical protein